MKTKLKILHLEDTATDAELVERELKKGKLQFEKLVVGNKAAFEKALNEFAPEIVLADHTLPSFDSLEAIKMMKQIGLKIPIILVSATVSDEFAVEVMKAGANDYILKDRLHRLPQAVMNAMEKNSAEQQLQESETFNKGVLSSLNSHIAVIDNNGTLIASNKAWDDFGIKNGITSLDRISKGSNYFDVCKRSIENGDCDATRALEGIHSVFRKEKRFFEMEYPCHSLEEERWFMLHVSPFGEDDTKVVISHQNITDRKTAENKLSNTSVELQKTLSEHTKILDSSLDVICTINANGEFVNVSAASHKVWGYTPEELIGSKFMNLVYDEDIDRTSKAAEKIISGIQVPLFENRYLHKSGRLVPILWTMNWDEKLQLIFCIAKDVTEKKRLEKAIETERDQFFEMFLKAPSAIGMLKGADHVFEMANPLYLQLIGKKDIIGKTVAEILPEVIEQGCIDIIDSVYATGKPYIGREVLIKFDKEGNGELSDAYLNYIYQVYRNEEGNIQGLFFFANDITEQILSRKEIEKSEKFFKGVIENSADMITLTDAAGKTIYASPAVTKNFGYSYEECLEMNIADIVHPDDALKMQEFFEKIMMHPGVPIEVPLIRDRKKDGSYMWVEGTATNFLEAEGINAIVANFRDITESKMADENIRFKANLLNRISQAAIATDLNGVVDYWNKAAENIYGWTPAEAIGKNILHLTPTQSTRVQALEIMDDLKNGRSWSGEFRVQRKDGTNFPALVTNSPIYDENNKLTGIIGISSDITEKKRLEELLDKTNRLARIGGWEIDVVKGTVFWSVITKEILEADSDFIPDLHTGKQMTKEGRDRNIVSKRIEDCIEKEIPWDEELQITTFKGNLKWIRTIGEAEFVQGKCSKLYGSFQDITERKKAEKEIRDSEEKRRLIMSGALDAIICLDTNDRITFWNPQAEFIFGWKEAEVMGQQLSEMIVPEPFRKYHSKGIKHYLKTGEGKSINVLLEIKATRRSGEEFPIELTVLPIKQGKELFFCAFIRDITERKKAECERIKMISDIVQRNSDLEQFSYIVSHNLRAPVANILGLGDLIGNEDYTQEVKNNFLEAMLDNVKRLDIVISDLNSILQVKGKLDTKKEKVILNELVESIKGSIQNIIEKENAEITTNFDVPAIHTVQSYLHSIFYNLIVNSIKYQKPGVPPQIVIRSELKEGSVVLTFEDNGMGMDLVKKREEVFGLYKRFHHHIEGKGMGLFLVKTQVELLGGKISIESEVNAGTKFTITIEKTTLN